MKIVVTNKLVYHKEHILEMGDVPDNQKEMVKRLVETYKKGEIEVVEFLSTLNVMFGRRPFNGQNYRTGYPFITRQIEGNRGAARLNLDVDIEDES